MLNNNVRNVIIVSIPDYNGGRYPTAIINKEYATEDFEYIEFRGDASEVLANRHKIFEEHREPFHETPRDYCQTLEELIIKALG